MFFCEALLGPDQAARVQATVERASGQPCPCRRGVVCPLIPAEGLRLDHGPLPRAERLPSVAEL